VITMRERASLIGGSLAFLEAPHGGTLVRLIVPAASARNGGKTT
jgi:signal transduction histidine kinase